MENEKLNCKFCNNLKIKNLNKQEHENVDFFSPSIFYFQLNFTFSSISQVI